jgi:hypothetical protein
MPQPQPAAPPRPPFPVLAAFLSYLVPGLGQICQGRVGKGLLFLFCLYTLFFYGMYLGHWSNVFLPDVVEDGAQPPIAWLPRPAWNVYNRLQFAGQFWIGVAAWPAIIQYNTPQDPRDDHSPLWGWERAPFESKAAGDFVPRGRNLAPANWPEKTLNELQIDGDKTWDLAWVFTVIAGVLNVLVIYDAYAGAAFGEAEPKPASEPEAAA